MPREQGNPTERKIIISKQYSNDSDSVEIKDPLHLSKQQILFLLGRGKKGEIFATDQFPPRIIN